MAVSACFAGGPALANPTNPAVVHGTATFQQAGGVLNVTNSHNAIINWGSFSIGVNELTRFIQPSALSAVLNRVTGQDPSAILGALQSNGKVFLINPNGIMFGAGAQINVAGLVASTLNLSNADFLAGRMNFTDGAGAGSVINQGAINASGGPVYLVGNAVTNQGIITSPQGEIVLAAGNSVELVNPGTPNLRVEIQADTHEARNLGSIAAEAGRIGIYAGLIKQGGVINADSVVSEGGRILLKSTKRTDIEAGSVTSARGTSGGQILVLSDMQEGTTSVQGTIDASSNAAGAPGNGGFIDTSGGQIQIGSGASIHTAGANGGANGTWLIDPIYDFHIGGANSNIDAATLVTALASNSIVIATANTGEPDYYGGGYFGSATWPDPIPSGNGDLFVNDSVVWNSANSLTLTAQRNVQVNNAITNAGSGDIRIFAGWDGSSSPGAPTLLTSGAIQLNAPVSTGGIVKLQASDSIGQSASGAIAASGLLAISTGSSVNLATATNSVGTVAGLAVGQFALKNSGNLEVGAVGGINGIEVNGASPGMHATLGLEVTGGNLTINKPVSVSGGNAIEMGIGGNASIAFTASGSITVNDSVEATGGNAGSASFMSTTGFAGGNAQVTMSAGSTLAVSSSGSVNATGGESGYISEGTGGNGGTALVQLTSAGNMTVDGTISATGGDMDYSGSGGGTGGNATVRLTSTAGTLSLNNNITVSADGGEGLNSGSVGGHALVDLKSAGNLSIAGNTTVTTDGGAGSSGANSGNGQIKIASTAGSVSINGSTIDADGGDAYYYSGGDGGNGSVQIEAAGNVTIANSTVTGSGGDGGDGASGGGGVVLISASGGISVSNYSYLSANGGDAGSSYYYSGSGTGGGGGLTMLAGGAITIDGSEGYASGGSGDTGGNAAINIIGGPVSLLNNATLGSNIGSGMTTDGIASVLVASASNLSLDSSSVSTDGFAALVGGSISLDNEASVTGATGTNATAAGGLMLSNESSITSINGIASITTGGDLLVQTDSSIYGTPDVVMKVGGKVRMNSGGVIEAGSANTLRLTFANPTTGGIVINGINGLVYDSATGTGFIAGGSPAVLGGSLIVTFDNNTVTTTTQNVPTQTLIVALTEAIKPPSKDESTGAMDEKEDPKKKKDAPACR